MKALTLALVAALAATSGGAQVPLSLDTSFRATRFVTGELLDNLPLADGSVVASGDYIWADNCCASTANGPFYWFRFLPDGSLDESWIPWGAGGLIYPVGPYYYLSSRYPKRRFQADGTTDTGFSPGNENHVNPNLLFGNGGELFVQADGKVLITGDHQLNDQWGPNAPGRYSLLRVDSTGKLDSTYHYRKTDGIIWNIVPTTQGRFLISGVYNTYEGLPEGRILRIWPDGSLDSTFHTNIIKGYSTCLVEQPDGRILASGQFVLQNEPDTMHLIRLMPDGALDTTFHNHTEYDRLPPTSFGAFGFGVSRVLPLGDGTMIVGGNFTHIDGQLRRGVALVDSTGHLLNTALNGEGALLTLEFNSTYMYSAVNSIKMAPDGSIFLAGVFKGFDDGTVRDTSLTFIVKLHGLSVGIHEIAPPAGQVRVWPNPGSDMLHIETGLKGKFDVRMLDATGRAVLEVSGSSGAIELSSVGLLPGVYLVEVNTANGRRTEKWVKQ